MKIIKSSVEINRDLANKAIDLWVEDNGRISELDCRETNTFKQFEIMVDRLYGENKRDDNILMFMYGMIMQDSPSIHDIMRANVEINMMPDYMDIVEGFIADRHSDIFLV